MRILVRTSKWAIWARRVGALALPLAAIPVLLHRSHLITSDNFLVIESIALGLAVLAMLMALVAFARLWFTGDQGWGRGMVAFVFGILCLAPAAYFAVLYLRSPSTPDVTTDFVNPPALVSFVESRFTTPAERAKIEAEFPNARTRNYPITAPQMFATIYTMVDDLGWDIRAQRAPQTEIETGSLNAIVTTLLGFPQEVAIRISGAPDGTTIAIRSASLTSFPDFGENGARIETFMLALDNEVTQMLRTAGPQQPADTGDN